MSNLAITIGSYRMPDFVRLNIRSCSRFVTSPILVSDDKSKESDDIGLVALEEGAAYYSSERRMSHFSGDIQAFINALQFGRDCESTFSLKLSQRMIPTSGRFFDAMIEAFKDPDVWVITPGRPPQQQIARKSASFYSKFGILTDAVAMRTNRIDPGRLAEFYRARFTSNPHPHAALVELTWGDLLATPEMAGHHRVLPEWTEHKPMEKKLYLRKSQSTGQEYINLGIELGVSGQFDMREWIRIEGPGNYWMRPNVV